MGTERVDIVTGCNCNNNCVFCVLSDSLKKSGTKTKEEIISDMKKHSSSCKFLTLTGGEVTMRPDIFELIEEARKLGFNQIHIQTNGRLLSYPKFCKKLIQGGVTSFTISFHAHNEDLGDSLSKTKNSFKQTIEGMKNIKKYGAKLITNTVISKKNYPHLLDITKKAIELGSDQVQMVFVRPQGQALKNFDDLIPRMTEVIPQVTQSIEYCKNKNKIILIEGIPPCLMKGYEEYVAEKHMPVIEVTAAKEFYMKKEKSKIKDNIKCSNCKLNNECTGIWTNYAKKFGFEELCPPN